MVIGTLEIKESFTLNTVPCAIEFENLKVSVFKIFM